MCRAPEGDQAQAFWQGLSVERTRDLHRWEGKPWLRRPKGAEIHVRAEPGANAAHLERTARCRAHAVAEAETDPLAVRGARIEVLRRGPVHVIRVTSEEPSVAREIIRRTEGIRADSAGPTSIARPARSVHSVGG